MLRWRLLLGAMLIAGFVGLCWLDSQASLPGAWLFPLALAISLLATSEVIWLLAARQLRPLSRVMYLGNLLLVASNWVPVVWPDNPLGSLGWPLTALAAGMLMAIVEEVCRYEAPGGVMERLALTLFGLLYVGLSLSFVAQLRLLGPDGASMKGQWGLAAVASLVIVVKMCDTGAYTAGRLWGRHKMAPVLSPGKTIEGAAGGIALACVGSWVALGWLFPLLAGPLVRPASWKGWMLFGLVVGLAGMVGDLAESLIKRDVGRKDSGWLPGFGGVLDVLDSILFAAPVAYWCWVFGLVGL